MSQPFMAGIGQRIKRYRKMNRWSAQQLATNTDGSVSRDTIANIENGRRADISVRHLLAIALALRVPPVALLIDLEHPLDTADIRFPGAAPAPLETTAPQIAVAAWLNGQSDNDTTNAGRWVSHVTALLRDYLDATDSTAVQNALDRVATPRPLDDRDEATKRVRATRALLLEAGVHLPATTP